MGATAGSEPPIGGPCDLLRVRLPGDLEPERAALLVRGERHPFVLVGRWAGGGALIGSEPVAVAPADADPFELLDALPEVSGAPTAGTGDAVGGGWFGYLGYSLGARIEDLDPPPPPGGPRLPPFSLAFYDHLLHRDATGRWWFEALVTPAREVAIHARLDDFRERMTALAATDPEAPPRNGSAAHADPAEAEMPRPFATEPWRPTPSPAGHARAVAACRERIHAGDLFQANICLRLGSTLTGDPLDLFAAALPQLAPDRAAFLAGPWGAVASLSPELFLTRHGSRVRTEPIKGTRSRPGNPACDEAARAGLAGSAKDRAENQMIVDMARNDLGRVCRYGTVEVEVTAEARSHTGVIHLVSEVAGELRPGIGNAELLRATFPPASVTGAPKIAACNVIAELESTRREIYTGAIGFAGPLAGMELNVAIRSFEFGPETGEAPRAAWLGVGGGIVADSDPDAEADECRTKALPLLAAIGAELAGAALAPGARAPLPLRLGPRPHPRPDPRGGIFETIRVEEGRPARLDRHLARLAASAAELYGAELPPDIEAEIERAAAEATEADRLRVDLAPQPAQPTAGPAGDTPATDTPAGEAAPAPRLIAKIQVGPRPRRRSLRLVPVCLPGGLGPHKWADRSLLDSLQAHVDPDIPLLCDLDGEVLEAAHAAVFAATGDGRLLTPSADGRILPSVGRALVLAGEAELPVGITEVAEARLHLAEIAAASAVYIVNALTGGLLRVELVVAPGG